MDIRRVPVLLGARHRQKLHGEIVVMPVIILMKTDSLAEPDPRWYEERRVWLRETRNSDVGEGGGVNGEGLEMGRGGEVQIAIWDLILKLAPAYCWGSYWLQKN